MLKTIDIVNCRVIEIKELTSLGKFIPWHDNPLDIPAGISSSPGPLINGHTWKGE